MGVFALVLITPGAVVGQAPIAVGKAAATTKPVQTWTLPRTPWGDPDL
jgi:hypothetical protein